MIAVTGAKNGSGWLKTSFASHQATAAPIPHCTMNTSRPARRSVRIRASEREREATRAGRSEADGMRRVSVIATPGD